MAKKEVTELDLYKKEARYIIEKLNAKLKLVGPMFYLAHNGMIYIKSTQSYAERFAVYYDPEMIPSRYGGALYDSIDLATFKNDYRISKVLIIPYENGDIEVGQTSDANNPDAKLTIHRIQPFRDDEVERAKIEKLILPEFYKKLPSMITEINLKDNFISLSEEEIESLDQGQMLELTDVAKGKRVYAYVTKEIFPCMKKDSKISYQALDIIGELDKKIVYFIYREELSDLGIFLYTLTSTYQNI